MTGNIVSTVSPFLMFGQVERARNVASAKANQQVPVFSSLPASAPNPPMLAWVQLATATNDPMYAAPYTMVVTLTGAGAIATVS